MNKRGKTGILLILTTLFTSLALCGIIPINNHFDQLPDEAKEWIKSSLDTLPEKNQVSAEFEFITIQLNYAPATHTYDIRISDRAPRQYTTKEEILKDLQTSTPALKKVQP